MATTYAISPATLVRDTLRDIPNVEQVFVSPEIDHGIGVLVVMDQKNHDAMKRLFAAEATIIDSLPGVSVSFDLVLRCGRPLAQIISPRGSLLFAR